MKVLIVGVSTRAIAQSAVAAGHKVISLDYFGDRDQPARAQVYGLQRDFKLTLTLKNLALAAGELASRVDGIVVGAGLENEPAFADLAFKNTWLCNPIDVVKNARNMKVVEECLGDTGLPIPRTVFPGEVIPENGVWLAKDLRRSGGKGVRLWENRAAVKDDMILQEYLKGSLASATFLADGKNAILLGMTYQYAGEKRLNARKFEWCGNVAPFMDDAILKIICRAIQRMTRKIGLVGLNGLDFIVRDGQPFLIEVNPRYSGSVELFEKLLGINAFTMHVNACRGILPGSGFIFPKRKFFGKAILYASKTLKLSSTDGWEEKGLADIPNAGETIPRGAPICTLLNNVANPEDCWKSLVEEAGIFYLSLLDQ